MRMASNTIEYTTNLEQSSTVIDPSKCPHCFCKQNTGGTYYCCKCGTVQLTSWIIKTDLRKGYR